MSGLPEKPAGSRTSSTPLAKRSAPTSRDADRGMVRMTPMVPSPSGRASRSYRPR